jgi:hypothetical protein
MIFLCFYRAKISNKNIVLVTWILSLFDQRFTFIMNIMDVDFSPLN